jgi:hypothetical protein
MNSFVRTEMVPDAHTFLHCESTNIPLPCMLWSSELGKTALINVIAFKHEFTILKVAQIASSI